MDDLDTKVVQDLDVKLEKARLAFSELMRAVEVSRTTDFAPDFVSSVCDH